MSKRMDMNFKNEMSKLFLKPTSPLKPNRKCECGYSPLKTNSLDDECLIILPLLNHITYPSLKMIPEREEIKDLYYNKENGEPKLHWCLFIEIDEKIDANTWSGFTSFGENLKLEIKSEQDEKPSTFDSIEIIKKNTVSE